MKTLRILFYCIPWVVALLGMFWILIHRFPPSGIIVFDIPFDGTSAWMDPFLPAERVSSPGMQEGGWFGQRIFQDPVYSASRVPGVFDEVDLSIEFRPNRQSIAEIGLLRDDASLSFELKPIWFAPLQDESWVSVSMDGMSGYVKKGVPESILASSDYLHLETWYATSTPLKMQDVSTGEHETRVSLRGSHDFWVIPANGTVRFEFELQDANRTENGRTVVLQIEQEGEVIQTKAIGIGGSRDVKMGSVVSALIEANNLEPGTYRVRLICDDDIFVRNIRTINERWVIGPRLVFGDLVGFATTTQAGRAWSNSRHLVLETFHDEGLQRVEFGSDSATLSKTHETVHLNRTDTETLPQLFVAPKGDIRIVGDGYFSFTSESFFVPQPRRVTVFTNPDAEGIRAIVTPYKKPEDLGDGWYRTHVAYELDPTRDHSRFVLSIPGALASNASLDIRRVTLSYKRPPLNLKEWVRVVRQELVNAWQRLRSVH